MQFVAIDQRVDSAGVGAVRDDHHVVADVLGEVLPHGFVDADDRGAEQLVGSRRGRHQRALPSRVHEHAVLDVDRRAGQVRRPVDQIQSPQVIDDVEAAVLLDPPRVDDLHPAREPRDRHVVDRVREEHEHLVTTARSGSSQWQRLAIHCSAPPTYSTGVAIATRTGRRSACAACRSGSGGEIVTTSRRACSCRTWRAKALRAARRSSIDSMDHPNVMTDLALQVQVHEQLHEPLPPPPLSPPEDG